jgi:hypothetical protein
MADGLGISNYPFDIRVAKARDEINDALRIGPSSQPKPDLMQQLGQYMNVQANPQQQMANINVPMGGGVSAGAQVGGGQNMPYGVQNVGVNYNAPSGFGAGVSYQPQQKIIGANMRIPFQEGGLATSLRTDPVHHERDVDFINTRNQHMRELAGMRAYAKGGLAMAEGGDVGDEIVVQARRDMAKPMFYGNVASLVGGGNYSGGGGEFFGAPGAGGPAISSYDIGALQNAINQAPKKPTPAPVEVPKPVSGPSAPVVLDVGRVGGNMRPSYGGGQADVMRIMDIGRNVGSTPKGVGARLGIGFAKGGGAWTRKEGKNPEGGLNAVGRASLKAQGQDIKPPVSAKQAKKSPKAAARRRSFCARMSGMPGPMKDDGGKPTRKALALRKWDC